MKKSLKLILVILIILLVGVSGFVVYEKVFNKEEINSNEVEVIDTEKEYVKIDDITLYLEMNEVSINKDAPNNKINVTGSIELSFDSEKYLGISLSGYCLGNNGEKYKVHGLGNGSGLFYNDTTNLIIMDDIPQEVEYTDGTKKSWNDVDWSNVKITYCKIDKLDAISNDGEDNYKEISFEKEFSNLDNFLNTLNGNANGDFEVSYNNLTIKQVAEGNNVNDGFQGLVIYKDGEEIISYEQSHLQSFNVLKDDKSKAVFYNEEEKVFFLNIIEWGAHRPKLLVISEEGEIIFDKSWNEGNITIDTDEWKVTVNYYTFCCMGRLPDVVDGKFTVNGKEYTKDDIDSGTIVYQYTNKQMNIISEDYKTFGEANPDAFK